MTPTPLNVTVEQGVAVFQCQHRSSNDVTWNVNGTPPSTSPNISIEKISLDEGFRSTLLITTLLDFNETTVECVATFYEGTDPFRFTPPVTLLIQGTTNLI